MKDPNPLVNGTGLAKLQAAGMQVEGPVLESAAQALNSGFIKRMESGLPLVRIKMGMSVDGRTALANGVSKWITCDASRDDVQLWRARSSAIMTGVGTVLADDPLLTVRASNIDLQGRQPLRVICDSHMRTPATAKIVGAKGTMIYTTATTRACGMAEVIQVSADAQGKLDLEMVLRELAMLGCNEVLVEAGATLCGALLERALVDELLLYVAPVLLGPQARSLFDLPLLSHMSERIEMQLLDTQQFGTDIRLRYRVINEF
jgi:diaminohydroxyphosphoribosylaminopyrimidine deaminase/5-amino-6-(5-phosphoribosylamino)uracil reductase